ncbi:putative c6 transcription [Diplodia seriata]|uniref:Putative c6 transcription n=1 Tax=Diplodia seriata TaxID=420778 RepID=A0A0G2DRS9_9PEZI|nr:putative c6 transcription [Diplodia seriata]
MLGPQCLSCKKRRVRCDTVLPGCGPCRKKGIDCPGYRKPLVWINRTESDATQPVQRPTKQGADGYGNFVFKAQRIKSSPKNDDDGDDGKGTRGDGVVVVRKLANRPPVPQLWPSADPDVLRLMDWAAYHNDVAAPTLVPDAAFVHMLQAPLGEWIACQQAVQDLWVLLAMQHRVISTAETNPQSDAEVCRYRVRSVAGLNRLLADPETQLTDDALEAVMMLLMAEVSARVRSCSVYDVMSSTTCNASHLRKPLFSAAWSDYAALQPHWDAFSHDSFVPLPWPLFWSIIRTNEVRASMARLNFAFSDAPDPAADERSAAHAFRAAVAAVLRHIRAFNADAWFRRRQDPARCVQVQNAADYVTLLHCLRDAAMLYALRTLVVELTAPFRAWLDDDGGSLDAVSDGKSAEDVRRGCVRALLARLGFPGVEGVAVSALPEGSYAWCGVVWPLFMAGYL